LLTAGAQTIDTTTHDKTFLTRRDLLYSGLAVARRRCSRSTTTTSPRRRSRRVAGLIEAPLALRVSKVNETTLTVAGLLAYGSVG